MRNTACEKFGSTECSVTQRTPENSGPSRNWIVVEEIWYERFERNFLSSFEYTTKTYDGCVGVEESNAAII